MDKSFYLPTICFYSSQHCVSTSLPLLLFFLPVPSLFCLFSLCLFFFLNSSTLSLFLSSILPTLLGYFSLSDFLGFFNLKTLSFSPSSYAPSLPLFLSRSSLFLSISFTFTLSPSLLLALTLSLFPDVCQIAVTHLSLSTTDENKHAQKTGCVCQVFCHLKMSSGDASRMK